MSNFQSYSTYTGPAPEAPTTIETAETQNSSMGIRITSTGPNRAVYDPSNGLIEEISSGRTQRVTEADFRASGVLGSAKNNGFPAQEVNAKSVVTVPGVGEMTAAMAVKMGLLGQSETGRYFELGAEELTANSKAVRGDAADQQQQIEQPTIEHLSDNSELELNLINTRLAPQVAEAHTNRIMDAAVTGSMEYSHIKELADQLGYTEDYTTKTVTNIVTELQAQADKAVLKAGMNPESL